MDEEKRSPEKGSPFAKNPAGMIHEIDRIMHNRITRAIPELQKSHRLILMELSHHDNVTQLDIVRATHLKAPTVSVSLQKMEYDGIVQRIRDPKDLRTSRVSLTEKGRAMDSSIIQIVQREHRAMEDCLTPEETETLQKLLLKIRNHLTEGEQDIENR